MLAQQPTTRIIPCYGLCLNRKCSPQFEKCFHCNSFIPDSQYKKYIIAAIERLKKANELIAKKHGSDIVFQQNLKDIHTFNSYLEKIDSNNRYTNQGEVI